MVGLDAHPVDVEVHMAKGLPGFEIVGLPETAVREARVRVRAAIGHSGFELPPRRVVLSLAPADLRKRGASLDLGIAVALLSAAGHVAPNRLEDTLLFGELSLSGELRSCRALLPQLAAARDRGLRQAVVPLSQLPEGAWVEGLDVRGAPDLLSVVAYLDGRQQLAASEADAVATAEAVDAPCLADVQGQASAKRALTLAAVGGHHTLLVGPPGAGKTMLARRLPGLLPGPSAAEAVEIATVRSAAGLPAKVGAVRRPFRAPHQTASAAALVGGGDPIRPGEVTLAHRGVLFLDELPEFSRPAIESFRTVLETGKAVVSRARERVEMPAAPLVVAAMNPCPCGHDGGARDLCRCSPGRIETYRGKVSGPILDRIDLQVALPPVDVAALGRGPRGESSADVRRRVAAARAVLCESAPALALPEQLNALPKDARELVVSGADQLGLSLRGLVSSLRVARSVAALDGRAEVRRADLAEAMSYRLLDEGSTERKERPWTR